MQVSHKKQVSIPFLTFISVATIVSPVGIVVMSKYGLSSIFYYGLIILLFFIPSALIASELSFRFPKEGGVYTWISEGLSPRISALCSWVMWAAIFFSFPLVFTFVAGIIAYTFSAGWLHQGLFVFAVCVLMNSISVLFGWFGIRASAWVGMFASIVGIILPLVLLLVFALVLFITGGVHLNDLANQTIIPKSINLSSFTLLGGTLFAFLGIESSAYFVRHVKKPKRDYPIALMLTVFIISFLAIFGSLAIALLVKVGHVSIVAGIMQGYLVFLNHYHLHYLIYAVAAIYTLGLLAILASYQAMFSQGLLALKKDNLLPKALTTVNRHGAAKGILILQGVLVTVLSLGYIFIPSVNEVYWLVEALISVLAGLRYIVFFIAAIRLSFIGSSQEAFFRIFKSRVVFIGVALMAMFSCAFAVVVSFIPPAQIEILNTRNYDAVLGGLTAATILFLAWVVARLHKRARREAAAVDLA